MNIEEVNGIMDLAVEELSMAQILFDAGKYRGSITHSYYAMFDAAKALLLTHDFISKKHDTILTQFSKSKPVISGNKDVNMLYSAGTAYKVRVTVDGKAVVGKYVTFKFNGVTKKFKTDSKGYATYKISTVKPKSTKYTITASYGV